MNYLVSLLNDNATHKNWLDSVSRIIPLNTLKRKCDRSTIILSVVLSLLLVIGLSIYLRVINNVTVKNINDFNSIPKNVRSITIAENALNNLDIEWDLSKYPKLKKLTINSGSLRSIKSLVICNNSHLEKITISDTKAFGSLYNTESFYIESSIIMDSN